MKTILALALALVPTFAFAGNCHQAVVQQVVAQPVVTFVQPVRTTQFVQVPVQQVQVVQHAAVVAQPVVVQQVRVHRVPVRQVQRTRTVTRRF